ncbi:MAG: hypothetical protein GY788_26980 [bacterium]|nr:hypothetical protein [bacterium]
MRGTTIPIRFIAAMLALGLFVAACESNSTPETSAGATTSTTLAPSTTSPDTTEPPTVIASGDLDPAVVEQLTEQIVELIAATEEVRGLPFLTNPTVTILTPEELAARVRIDLEDELDPDELAVDTRLMQLLGKLEPSDDLEMMLVDLYSEQVAGFYDLETAELVIGGEAADLTPLTASVVVHELVHALTNQHFVFNDEYQAMWDEERFDEGAAFQSLLEGDATYFQLVYIQELPLAEQMAMARESLEQMANSSVINSVPAWMQNDLAFPYDTGQVFVESLVSAGGVAAVDAAYTNRPVSTEAVMHPPRFVSGEGALAVEPLALELDGYTTHETSTWGEWGFRLLLDDTAAAGASAQAANGWGGDSYQVLYDNDDVVFALAYKGDTEEDAFELVDAMITYVTETLEMGEGVGETGGVAFTAEDGRYAYIDRIGDGFSFVVATDAAAGAAAADQIRVP